MTRGEAWAVREAFETISRVLGPFAPHVAEELWESLGFPPFLADAPWPEADPAMLVSDQALVVVQVNGKVRGKLSMASGAAESDVLLAARADGRIAAYLDGKPVRKVVFVPDRLLNVVVE
jgi:leucyl-tRNA synthetase